MVLSVGQRRSEPYTKGDFWTEKAKQALRLNQNIDDSVRLLGNAIIPFVLWFAIDLFLQWLKRWDSPPRTLRSKPPNLRHPQAPNVPSISRREEAMNSRCFPRRRAHLARPIRRQLAKLP